MGLTVSDVREKFDGKISVREGVKVCCAKCRFVSVRKERY